MPWELTAAYVGCARAKIPLASLYSEPCAIALDEVLLTVRPRQLQVESQRDDGSGMQAADSSGDAAGETGFVAEGLDDLAAGETPPEVRAGAWAADRPVVKEAELDCTLKVAASQRMLSWLTELQRRPAPAARRPTAPC